MRQGTAVGCKPGTSFTGRTPTSFPPRAHCTATSQTRSDSLESGGCDEGAGEASCWSGSGAGTSRPTRYAWVKRVRDADRAGPASTTRTAPTSSRTQAPLSPGQHSPRLHRSDSRARSRSAGPISAAPRIAAPRKLHITTRKRQRCPWAAARGEFRILQHPRALAVQSFRSSDRSQRELRLIDIAGDWRDDAAGRLCSWVHIRITTGLVINGHAWPTLRNLRIVAAGCDRHLARDRTQSGSRSQFVVGRQAEFSCDDISHTAVRVHSDSRNRHHRYRCCVFSDCSRVAATMMQ